MAEDGRYICSPYFTISEDLDANEKVQHDLVVDNENKWAKYLPFRSLVIANPSTKEISVKLDDGSDKVYIQGGTEKLLTSSGFRRFTIENEEATATVKKLRYTFYKQVGADEILIELGKRQNLIDRKDVANFGVVRP